MTVDARGRVDAGAGDRSDGRTPRSGATADVVAPAAALRDVFATLNGEGIRFCHWKSNSHLVEALQGLTDLDLLVDRGRAADFRRVLAAHDFKPLRAAPGKHYEGVENHLGFDAPSGRLLHLHVHFDLVLGQQFVKDHRIPIEEQMLASVRDLHGCPVPSAPLELSILAMRAVLKYRARDAVKDMLGIRSPAIPRHIRNEAAWLLDQSSIDDVQETLSAIDVPLPDELIVEIIALLTSSARIGGRAFLLRTGVRRALRPFRRIPRSTATLRYLGAIGRKRMRRLGIGKKHRMAPAAGGTTIAFIGSDGAGKSTVIGLTSEWLAARLDVAVVYLGNPKGSRRVAVTKQAARTARAGARRASQLLDEEHPVASATREVWYVLLGLRRVLEAQHRVKAYDEAVSRARTGSVALFDRYPLDHVQIAGRAMDGARLAAEIPSPRGLVRRLAERERDIYRRILPPDHVVALTVTPEVSLERKPDHDRVAIEQKASAVRRAAERDDAIVVIDADRALTDVVGDVKSTVWTWL